MTVPKMCIRDRALADELNERYGGSWLMPVFMKAIITQPKEQAVSYTHLDVYKRQAWGFFIA